MYETQNKKIIRYLAKKDLQSKKMGNRFIMITIVMAAALIMVMSLFPGSIKLDTQRQLTKAQDVIYHDVTKEQIKKLQSDQRFSYMTLDKMGEQMEINDYMIWQVYYDGNSKDIKTVELVEGRLPEKEQEVAVPKSYMKKTVQRVKVGTTIRVPFLSGKTEEYVVSGFTKDIKNSRTYPILHSKAYAENGSGLKDVNYDVLAKVADAKSMTQSEFLDVIRTAAKDAGVPRSHVNENNDFVGTLPSSELGADSLAVIVIGLIILVAGIMVIYSVFYISVTGKVREYGQLRTLGMTRKQIRKLVRGEGMILAFRAVPAGLLLGGIVSWAIKPGGFSLINTIIMAAAVFAGALLTVQVSVMKPAKKAACVSPVEASRYSAYSGEEYRGATKKTRRRITPFSLARMNSVRNRKKTFITLLSLGISGILFIGAVTFQASMDKDKYARSGVFQLGEFDISISENASSTAKRGEGQIQLEKPFTEELYDQIQQIAGVLKEYKPGLTDG